MYSNKRPRTEVGMCDDRISDLPDSLLLHILSFLETKHVVVTCMLSKRWRTLWRFIHKLDFNDESFGSLESFVQFVDAALHLVHFNSVQIFVLKCRRFSVPPVKLYIWTNAAVSHKLTHLELHFSEPSFSFPASIFTCNTLSVLKLAGTSMSNLSMVDLPSLKVLYLKMVRSPNPECAVRLLSNCARLEELSLYFSVPFDLMRLMHNIPRFEYLLFASLLNTMIPMEVLSNVRTLYILGDYVRFDNVPTFNNLTMLRIEKSESSNLNCNIISLLPSFPKLQTLVICKYGDYDFDDDGLMNFSTPDVPLCLSSQLEKFAIFGITGSDLEFEIIKFIMKYARVLKTLVVGSNGTNERNDLEMLKTLSSYPRCSPTCELLFINVLEKY